MPAQITDSSRMPEILSLLENLAINVERNDKCMDAGVMRRVKPDGKVYFFIDFAMISIGIMVTLEGDDIQRVDEAIAANRSTLAIHVTPYREANRAHTRALHKFEEDTYIKARNMRDEILANDEFSLNADLQSDEWYKKTIKAGNPKVEKLAIEFSELYAMSSPGLPLDVHIEQSMKNINVNLTF